MTNFAELDVLHHCRTGSARPALMRWFPWRRTALAWGAFSGHGPRHELF